jgi:hypothetical protein
VQGTAETQRRGGSAEKYNRFDQSRKNAVCFDHFEIWFDGLAMDGHFHAIVLVADAMRWRISGDLLAMCWRS